MPVAVTLAMHAHLNTCFRRFARLAIAGGLLTQRDVSALYGLVVAHVGADTLALLEA
jgi:hypothetical protein